MVKHTERLQIGSFAYYQTERFAFTSKRIAIMWISFHHHGVGKKIKSSVVLDNDKTE